MKKSLLILRRCEPSVGVHHVAECRRRIVIYCECQKNHAASIGGHAVDGCREFIAEGEEGTTGALKCGACGCHRSFHRRVQECEVTCECSSLQLWRQ